MIGAASATCLVLSVVLLCARQIDMAAQVCAVQALFAAAILADAATGAALLAFALNGIALPWAIMRMGKGSVMTWRGTAVRSWAAVLAVLVATVVVLARLGVSGQAAAGTSVVLLGLLLLGLRPHPLGPALGLLSSQNGLALVGIWTPDLTLPMALAIAVPLTPVMALAESRFRR